MYVWEKAFIARLCIRLQVLHMTVYVSIYCIQTGGCPKKYRLIEKE